ncbi:MAG: hypothetical protein ACRCU3_10360 [Eubacteriaceae bacterium]
MKKGINLLPIEPKIKLKKSLSFKKIGVYSSIMSILLGVFFYGCLYYMNAERLEKIKYLEEVIALENNRQIPLESLEIQSRDLMMREKLIKKIGRGHLIPGEIFIGFQKSRVPEIKLLNYAYDQSKNQLDLWCQTEEKTEISRFRNRLLETNLFSEGHIQKSQEIKDRTFFVDQEENLESESESEIETHWEFLIQLNMLEDVNDEE